MVCRVALYVRPSPQGLVEPPGLFSTVATPRTYPLEVYTVLIIITYPIIFSSTDGISIILIKRMASRETHSPHAPMTSSFRQSSPLVACMRPPKQLLMRTKRSESEHDLECSAADIVRVR